MRVVSMAVMSGLLALACGLGGPVEPSEPRESFDTLFEEVPAVFQGLDLPYYGGKLGRTSERSMVVSYSYDRAEIRGIVLPTPGQLREMWPEALEEEGWTETSRSLSGNGTLDVSYTLPDGRSGDLTVRPEGTLWWVILDVFGEPDP